ncbi:MAG: hypothetical protein JNK60_19180 [Acidobacteria bacterium]|nr:hypothetical protein [Acidobacteriota bacterium]
MQLRFRLLLGVVCSGALSGLLSATPPQGEVEIPLPAYDALRAAAKAPRPTPVPTPGFAGVRVRRATLVPRLLDLAAPRLRFDAELEVRIAGDPAAPVRVYEGGPPLDGWTVSPEGTLALSAHGLGLVAPREGLYRVTLSGEVAGTADESTGTFTFELPRLAGAPVAFDLVEPKDPPLESLTARGAYAIRDLDSRFTRVVAGSGAAHLDLTPRRRAEEPAVLSGSLTHAITLGGDALRHEIRLNVKVLRGALEERELKLPGAALVTVSGPVTATGPDANGNVSLRVSPALRKGQELQATLTLLSPPGPQTANALELVPAALSGPAGEALERTLVLRAPSGLAVSASPDDDYTPVPPRGRSLAGDASGPGTAPEDGTALAFRIHPTAPRPLAVSFERLTPLAVATALARVSATVFVGATGLLRTSVVADVLSRGRGSLRFRIPRDARLLAVRVNDAPAAATRPSPEVLVVPLPGKSAEARIGLLLETDGSPLAPGTALTLVATAPEEPLESYLWNVVLPPGFEVKEPGRPQAPRQRNAARDPAPASGDVIAYAVRLATEDAARAPEAAWSPRTGLPDAPAAFTTEIRDSGDTPPPLTLTVVASRKEKEPWF